MESIIFYSAAILLLGYTYITDRETAKRAVKKSLKGFLALLPQLSFILILIGIGLAFLSPEAISAIIGGDSGLLGGALSIAIGSASILPSFIAIPLGATLVENGAGLPQVAGFISALMGVGIVTFPMEKAYFGTKFAIYRNIGCLLMTILFVALVPIVIGGQL